MICSVCEREYGDLSQNIGSCPACLGDEPYEPLEPDEGDWVTEDHVTFRQHGAGKDAFVVNPGEDWLLALKDQMDADRFWPNAWLLSDHGNYHILRMKDG